MVSAKTSQVIRAVKPTLIARGGTFSGFVNTHIGGEDDTDGSWEALYVDPVARIGGVFYTRLLAYLTDFATATPAGLGQPADQSTADLAAAWAAAPAILS